MSLVKSGELRAGYESLAAKLATDDTAGHMRPYVSARLVEDVTVESTFEQYGREFTFFADEAAVRGGKELGPSPMRYFLSGIVFCLIGWYAKGSTFADVDVEGLEVDARTYLDMRGEHGFTSVPANPQWIVLDIRVTSPSPSSNVLAMLEWGDARCPLGVFARRAVPVYQQVTHNDEVILDTVPAEAR